MLILAGWRCNSQPHRSPPSRRHVNPTSLRPRWRDAEGLLSRLVHCPISSSSGEPSHRLRYPDVHRRRPQYHACKPQLEVSFSKPNKLTGDCSWYVRSVASSLRDISDRRIVLLASTELSLYSMNTMALPLMIRAWRTSSRLLVIEDWKVSILLADLEIIFLGVDFFTRTFLCLCLAFPGKCAFTSLGRTCRW